MTIRPVIVYPDPESDYWIAECPLLPICVSQGKTRQEVLTNIKEAIELHIASLHDLGKPIPPDVETVPLPVAA